MQTYKKILSVILVAILFSGLPALGVQFDICTGEQNCPHCAVAASKTMAEHSHAGNPPGNCCAGNRHQPCDIHSDQTITPTACLFSRRSASSQDSVTVLTSAQHSICIIIPNTIFNRLSPGRLPPPDTPIFIQKSSLLC